MPDGGVTGMRDALIVIVALALLAANAVLIWWAWRRPSEKRNVLWYDPPLVFDDTLLYDYPWYRGPGWSWWWHEHEGRHHPSVHVSNVNNNKWGPPPPATPSAPTPPSEPLPPPAAAMMPPSDNSAQPLPPVLSTGDDLP